jgi:benzoylformate decarboxylase
LITTEQFSLPLSSLGGPDGAGNNVYLPPPGGSEGYGVGAPIGLKLAAPDRPVVGLVGDGSLYFADSGIWTSVHHKIPVLYVVPNNQAYGIVAGYYGQAAPAMSESGVYAGVALQGIDPVKIADGYGMEAMRVEEESRLQDAIDYGLKTVQDEGRPFLLDIRVPLGLPPGGRPATPYHLST